MWVARSCSGRCAGMQAGYWMCVEGAMAPEGVVRALRLPSTTVVVVIKRAVWSWHSMSDTEADEDYPQMGHQPSSSCRALLLLTCPLDFHSHHLALFGGCMTLVCLQIALRPGISSACKANHPDDVLVRSELQGWCKEVCHGSSDWCNAAMKACQWACDPTSRQEIREIQTWVIFCCLMGTEWA